MKKCIVTAFVLIAVAKIAPAWEVEEHHRLASIAYTTALSEFGFVESDSVYRRIIAGRRVGIPILLHNGETFGAFTASMAADDRRRARYHDRGRTILDQIRPLSADDLDMACQDHSGEVVSSAEDAELSVVANYWIHHYIALRRASDAGRRGDGEALAVALTYEAIAQGYLSDAFSAGHLLLQFHDPFRGIIRVNYPHAHRQFNTAGVYVLNSRGDAWQTFGDKLLFWYEPTRRFVVEACETSLREVLLAYFVVAGDNDIRERVRQWALDVAGSASLDAIVAAWTANQSGEDAYVQSRVPTLLLLPMPVSASWSIKSPELDSYGIHLRRHYPQLQDSSYHDPDLDDINKTFLYPKSSVPAWMIPEALDGRDPAAVIRMDPEVASVRYAQRTRIPPSQGGVLITAGGGVAFSEQGDGGVTSVGLGYGLTDRFVALDYTSLELVLNPTYGKQDAVILAPTAGGGILLPRRVTGGVVDALRLELGYAWGLDEPFKDHGVKLTIGLESAPLSLGFTYLGVTARLKYQWLFMEETLGAALLELVVH